MIKISLNLILIGIFSFLLANNDIQTNNLENKFEQSSFDENKKNEIEADKEIFSECKNERNSYCENHMEEVTIIPYEYSKINEYEKK